MIVVTQPIISKISPELWAQWLRLCPSGKGPWWGKYCFSSSSFLSFIHDCRHGWAVFKDLFRLKSLAIVYFKHGNGSSQKTSLNYRDKHMLKETALIETDRSHKIRIPKWVKMCKFVKHLISPKMQPIMSIKNRQRKEKTSIYAGTS